MMTRKRIYLVLLVLWAGFTLFLTSLPHPGIDLPFSFADKVAHFGFYGVMGFLCAMWRRESGSTKGSAATAGLLFVAIVGAVDEGHQHWIPGRSTDVFDWIADMAGGGIGALCSTILPLLLPFLLTE
ncbi:MAG: VanZ family protein [Deltaproteobacteria bacterium]|nr:VanZ family protein [Candidatus Deferrimicrobiaceae bacterium]